MKKGKRLIALLLAVVLTVGILPATAHAAEDDNLIDIHIDGTQDYDEINEVLEYVNQYRAEVGVEPVVLDAELTKYAMQRATELAFSCNHTRPDKTQWHTILDGTVFGGTCGENIARGYPNAAAVSEGWYNSDGHYDNMVAGWKSIGIGCFYQGDGTRYWVQLFSTGSSGKVSTTTGVKNVQSVPVAVHRDLFSFSIGPTTGENNTIQLFAGQEQKMKIAIGNLLSIDGGIEPADEIKITSSDTSVVKVKGRTLIGVAAGKCEVTFDVYGYIVTLPVEVYPPTISLSYTKNSTLDSAEITWDDPTGEAQLYYKNVKDSEWTLDKWSDDGSTTLYMEDGQTYSVVLRVPSGKNYMDVSETITVTSTRINIVAKPQDVWVGKGEKAVVKVEAEGANLTYTWYVKDPGEDTYFVRSSVTTPTYSTTMTEEVDGRKLYCEIKNGIYVTQTPTVTMRMGASITKQPKDAYVDSGETAKVTLKAEGEELTYQWYYKNKGDSKFKLTTSFTGNSYSVKMNEDRDGRQVYCVVSDKHGTQTKSKVVTLGIKKDLKITKQPATGYAKLGEKASVTVKASGNGLTYTWYIKNAGSSKYSKSSVTSATYTATMSEKSKDRYLYCVVTDAHGNTEKTKTVRLREVVSVVTEPKTSYAQSGKTVKTKVVASGDGLTYQWYVKNAGEDEYTKSSVTSASYSTKMNSKSKGRRIYCVITDEYGNSVQTKTVLLRMAATITTQPKNVTAEKGKTVKTTVKAVGDGLTYQWYIKNEGSSKFSKSSVTTATYSCEMSEKSDGRQIYCVVTDKYGKTAQSNTVVLTMK